MTRRLQSILGSLAILCAALVLAPAHPPANAAAPPADSVKPVDDAWRAALPANPEAATRAYLARLSPEARARSDAYFEGGYWLQGIGLAWTLAVSALLLWTPISLRMRAFAERRFKRRFPQAMAYAAMYLVVVFLLTLPLTIYAGFTREHAYGMATQGFGAWFLEQLEGFGISLVLGAPFIAFLLAIVRRFERTWWIWGTVAVSAMTGVLIAVSPVFIEPIFNKYEPLPVSPLQQRILSLTRANGVPADNVMVFDASRQTTRVSANVSGLFGTAAVRLNDNLLKRCTDPEVLAVVGHETGHYAMNHIPKSIVMFGVMYAALFAFTAWASRRLLARFGQRWGVPSLHDPGALPLLAAVVAVAGFLSTPVQNTITRTMESEADMFGLDAAREPDGMAEAMMKLIEYRKAEPGPIEEFVFFDHPSAHSRIAMAMRWKAETAKAAAAADAPAR